MFILLEGKVPSKKNSKRIIRIKGRPMIISSADYIKWEKEAVKDIKTQVDIKAPIKCCDLCVGFSFPDNRRCDLSNKFESIADALVKAGVIEDDCWQVVRSINVFQFDTKRHGAYIAIIERNEDGSPVVNV
jgi:Holliday junction resolvase RusA-like endonuclease